MTTSTLPLSRAWRARVLFLVVTLSSTPVFPARAAQQSFWPFNLFPAPGASLTYTSAVSASASVPTVGVITSRHFRLSNFTGPITLPGPGATVTHDNAATIFDSETSLDGGANWAPYTGSGATRLTLRHTNEVEGVRWFELELSTQDIPVNGSYGAATVRESPIQASRGVLTVTATNGGLLYSGNIDFHVEVSVDNGATWYPFSAPAYLEYTAPPGTPARLSMSRAGGTVTFCWQTEAIGQYQLQATDWLDGQNWYDLGGPVNGTGGQVCLAEAFEAGTNMYYRVELRPQGLLQK